MLATLVAACGGGDDSGGGGGSTKKVDVAAELKKPANITVWAWTPGTEEAVEDVREGPPEHQGQAAERGPGPAALPQGAHRPEVGQGPAGRHPHGVPVHPELHAHEEPARHDAVPAGQLHVELPRVDPEADPGRRRDLRRAVGHRPARLHLPRGPAQEGRHQDADQDLGRVRRRGDQVPQGQPEVVPRQHAGRPDGAVARAVLAERRTAVHDRSGELQGRPDRSEDQAGHRVLGQALRRPARSRTTPTSRTPGTRASPGTSTRAGCPRPGDRSSSRTTRRTPRASGAPRRSRSGRRARRSPATGAARRSRS